MNRNINNIQKSINELLNSNTSLRKRARNKNTYNKVLFIEAIKNIEVIMTTSAILSNDYGISLAKYEEMVHMVFEQLFELHYGEEILSLITFYLYHRINEDGTTNDLLDINKNPIPLKTAEDLWELVDYHSKNSK